MTKRNTGDGRQSRRFVGVIEENTGVGPLLPGWRYHVKRRMLAVEVLESYKEAKQKLTLGGV